MYGYSMRSYKGVIIIKLKSISFPGLDGEYKIPQTAADVGAATEAFVTNAIAQAQLGGGSGDIDLSGYATKDDLSKLTAEDVGAAPSSHATNKNNPHGVTASQVGAAPSSHNHAADNITSGTLGVARGGTGKATHTSNAVLTGNGTSAVNNVATASGALYATAANGAAKFGTLPVAQGGTGATTAAAALANLGGVSMKLLWTNASPSSAFANQTLTLDLSSYDAVEVEFGYSKDYPNDSVVVRAFIGHTGTAYMQANMSNSNGYLLTLSRSVIPYTNSITIYPCYWKYSNEKANSTHNDYAIPTRIYGIKGVG